MHHVSLVPKYRNVLPEKVNITAFFLFVCLFASMFSLTERKLRKPTSVGARISRALTRGQAPARRSVMVTGPLSAPRIGITLL